MSFRGGIAFILVLACGSGPFAFGQQLVIEEALPPVHIEDEEAARPAQSALTEAVSTVNETTQFTATQQYAAPAAGPCQCAACQAKAEAKTQEDLKKAVAGAYKLIFYDNNFTYINNPDYNDCYFGDSLKQLQFGDCWTVDLGGQYRARYHDEQNHRGLGLTGNDDEFLLHRTRLFANAKYGDNWRLYGEYLDAESNYEDFPPRAIEVNRSDLLNLFVDWKFLETDGGNMTARVGRQELVYGNQRLVSPLDWANTRRTFEGAKFFWVGDDWNIDAFYTRPVIVDQKQFDSPDYDQEFMGIYSTYKAVKDRTLDFYYLRYNNDRAPNDFKYDTLGSRLFTTEEEWLFETEGAMQFGDNTGGSGHGAGFAMGGIGRKWECHDWKPVLWANYDWASGGNTLGGRRGFDHLFPLAHKYLGFMDLFGRSNINTPNVQLTMQPHEKLQVIAWYYYFFLDRIDDTPYNVNMTPFAPGVAPGSRDLGQELDLLFMYTINPRMDLWFGYSHFWSGDYYDTPGLPHSGDADFFYTQYTWNF